MAGFLYFLNGWSNPVTPKLIDELGLRYAFDRAPMFAPLTGRTPSGAPGTLIGDRDRIEGRGSAFKFDGAGQRWEPMPMPPSAAAPDAATRPDVWVGYWRANSPTPADLVRPGALPGPMVRLADGQRWQVPQLIVHAGADGFTLNLPAYVDMDANGGLVPGDTVDEYRDAAELAEQVFVALRNGCSRAQGVVLSTQLLAVNYALSLFEATRMLRLFRDDAGLTDVVRAAGDHERFEAWREKKTPASNQLASIG